MPTPILLDPSLIANGTPFAKRETNQLPNPSAETAIETGVTSVSSTTPVNLVTNPRAGLDTTGVNSITASATVVRITANVPAGLATGYEWAGTVSGTSAGFRLGRTGTGTGGYPVVAGTAYSARADVNVASVSEGSVTSIRLRLFWFKADGSAAATAFSEGTAVSSPAPGDRVLVADGLVAPADAAFCTVQIVTFQANPTTFTIRASGLMLVAGATAPAYFDGDDPRFRWTGDAHASTSAPLLATYTRNNTGWAKAGVWARRHEMVRSNAGSLTAFLGSLPTGLAGIPVTPGRYYAGRVSLNVERMDVGWTSLAVELFWYRSTGAASTVVANSVGAATAPALGQEEQRVIVAQAPSDAAFCAVRVTGSVNPAGVVSRFITRTDAYALFDLGTDAKPADGLSLATDVPAYFDGDTPGYLWEGTPHASRSIPAPVRRTQLDLNSGTIRVRPDGPDWGESSVEPQMAQGNFGSVPLGDAVVPNRQVTIPLTLGMDGGAGYAGAKKALQAKVGLFQTEGGWIQRDVDGLYGDIVGASLKVADKYSHLRVNEADLVLDVLPDWYGDEIALDPIVSSGPDLIGVLKQGGVPAVIGGDYPARCRIVVENGSASDQLGLLFGLRCRHYSAAATAALAYAAQSLTPLDMAVNATVASTPCVRHPNLSTSWTPVLGTNLTAGTFLTHTGTYRVRARVHTTSAGAPHPVTGIRPLPGLRLVYDVGDLALPTDNPPVTIPGANNFYLVDLGEIRLDPGPGVHRWAGQVQARGPVGAENVSIHRLELVPLADGAGVLRGAKNPGTFIQEAISRDEFNQPAGTLGGKVAAKGGTWTTAGYPNPFSVVAGTDRLLRRSRGATTGGPDEHWARLGTSTLANVRVSVTITAKDGIGGVLARYVDVNNWVGLFTLANGFGYIYKCVGGVWTLLDNVVLGSSTPATTGVTSAPRVLELVLTVIGPDVSATVGSALRVVSDPDLAAGGPLAVGGHGIYDHTYGGTGNRDYDNFRVDPVLADPVVAASRAAELSTDGMSRQDSTGTAFGPVSHVTGDNPRLPPSGLEERPVELFLKGSRGDFGALPDPSASDGLTARVFVRPSFLAP